jgi:hypothetical protein
METVIEHDIALGSGASSALNAIVAVIAIFFVVGISMQVLRIYPFNEGSSNTPSLPLLNLNTD